MLKGFIHSKLLCVEVSRAENKQSEALFSSADVWILYWFFCKMPYCEWEHGILVFFCPVNLDGKNFVIQIFGDFCRLPIKCKEASYIASISMIMSCTLPAYTITINQHDYVLYTACLHNLDKTLMGIYTETMQDSETRVRHFEIRVRRLRY
jgi:hypothetical protein